MVLARSDDEAPEEFSFSTGKKSTLEQGEKEQKAKKRLRDQQKEIRRKRTQFLQKTAKEHKKN